VLAPDNERDAHAADARWLLKALGELEIIE
jgi:hypothetical protein